jgi:hypothetical protein
MPLFESLANRIRKEQEAVRERKKIDAYKVQLQKKENKKNLKEIAKQELAAGHLKKHSTKENVQVVASHVHKTVNSFANPAYSLSGLLRKKKR